MTRYLVVLSILNISILFAQESKDAGRAGLLQAFAFEQGIASGDTGLVHQRLDIDLVSGLDDDTAYYTVHQFLTCRYTAALPSAVTFDAYLTLVIDSASVGGNRKTVVRTSESVTIPLTAGDFVSDSCIVELWYHYEGTGQRGFFYYHQSPSTGTLEKLAYTFTEPTDSPYWFVTRNDTRIKPTLEMNITVPAGYLAGSNGALIGTTSNPDGSLTFHWREDYPIAMYLTMFAVSKYSTYSDYYHRVSNPSDSVEIKYYMWPDDEDSPLLPSITYSAKRCFVNVVDMIRFYSTIFGEYPFDKYGMVAVYPFGPGGMEHQTLTTIHRNWIKVRQVDGEHGFYEGGIAHEMVHQWFGDLITCDTWADIWLNESFATYGDKLWQEHFYGEQRYKDLMQSTMNFSNPSWADPVYVNPPPAYLFGDVVYDKGSWVLHMLRYVMGDSSFFALLKTYAQDPDFRFRTAQTFQFTDLAARVAHRNLSKFFDQWLMKIGWPVYEYSSLQAPLSGGYGIQLTLSQVQDDPSKAGPVPNDGTIFAMPVQFRFFFAGGDTLITVPDSLREQTFLFSFSQRVDSIVCDPDNRILKQLYNPNQIPESTATLPGSPSEFHLYQNYPNPFAPGGPAVTGGAQITMIPYDVPNNVRVTLTITNLLGQTVRHLVDSIQGAGKLGAAWDGRDDGNRPVASGVYFVTMRVGSFLSTQKLLLLR